MSINSNDSLSQTEAGKLFMYNGAPYRRKGAPTANIKQLCTLVNTCQAEKHQDPRVFYVTYLQIVGQNAIQKLMKT